MADVRDAMNDFQYLMDKNIEKVEGYLYNVNKGDRKNITVEEYGNLLTTLHADIGQALNKFPGKDQRASNREKMRYLVDMIYDADKKAPVQYDSPAKSLSVVRAVLQNLRTAKYDVDYPPARRHCMCFAAPNCLHRTWCKCGRAPPMFALYSQEPDACAACRTPDHHRVEDYDVKFPDNVLRKDIEVNIDEVMSGKSAIVFPKTFGPFQRLFVHQVAESKGLPSCSMGQDDERRCYVFCNSVEKEVNIARSSQPPRRAPERVPKGTGRGAAGLSARAIAMTTAAVLPGVAEARATAKGLGIRMTVDPCTKTRASMRTPAVTRAATRTSRAGAATRAGLASTASGRGARTRDKLRLPTVKHPLPPRKKMSAFSNT
jgi:hypothetical protein